MEKKINDFLKHIVLEVMRKYEVSEEHAYKVLFSTLKNYRPGILNDALYLIETDREDFD